MPLFSIGDRSLFLRDSGPRRISPPQPAVIIEAGLGSSSSDWVADQRLIAEFAPVYSYDRAGYGRSKKTSASSEPAQPPTASKICDDLTKLLEAANVPPPWVLVGHSYGGVFVREFLAMHGKEKIVGMVIVDSLAMMKKLPLGWMSF